MSREVLEDMYKATQNIEKRKEARHKFAETLGTITGATVALALDATMIWAVLNFMIGFQLTWVGCLGIVILANAAVVKYRRR